MYLYLLYCVCKFTGICAKVAQNRETKRAKGEKTQKSYAFSFFLCAFVLTKETFEIGLWHKVGSPLACK